MLMMKLIIPSTWCMGGEGDECDGDAVDGDGGELVTVMRMLMTTMIVIPCTWRM